MTRTKPQVRRILKSDTPCGDCKHYADLGWMKVENMPMLGDLTCGNECSCELQFEDDIQ